MKLSLSCILKGSKSIKMSLCMFCCIEVQWNLMLAFLVEETEADLKGIIK